MMNAIGKCSVVALIALVLVLLMAPTSGGFPSRPRFLSVGVGQAAPTQSGRIVLSGNYDSAAGNQINVSNTSASCTSDTCEPLNFTNGTDADLRFKLTDVGAATKFAQIGPENFNIPLRVKSRATTQELLKSSAVSVLVSSGSATSYNAGTCSNVSTGRAQCDITAAGFTQAPLCLASASNAASAPPATACSVGNVSTTSFNVLNYDMAGAATSGICTVHCIGI